MSEIIEHYWVNQNGKVFKMIVTHVGGDIKIRLERL